MSQWTTILTAEELEARYALTASLDPRFAAQERAFYEGRTIHQLRVLKAQAWRGSEPDAYQIASTYLAMKEAQ